MIRFDCRLARTDFELQVAFEAERGVTALFGPSGSGKSTIIRLLAGLEEPDDGRIEIDGTMLLDTRARIAVPPHKRRIGLVFQDALLFPHFSVRKNLTYGHFFTPASERRIGQDAVIAVLGIEHLLERRPDTLSGGERQRVSIGRALLASPRLLLMDEPLASLDSARKLEILPFIEKLRDEFTIPIIYVSHSADEISRLANHVVRLERGLVVTAGKAADVLPSKAPLMGGEHPEARSILSAPVKSILPEYGVTVLDHPAGEIVVPGCHKGTGEMRFGIRASDVTVTTTGAGRTTVGSVLHGHVLTIVEHEGDAALISIQLKGGEKLRASASRLMIDRLGLAVGQPVEAIVHKASVDQPGSTG